MIQSKLIGILVSILLLVLSTSGCFYLGYKQGYNEGTQEVEGKYQKAQLEALRASNTATNQVNSDITSIAKVTEVKKSNQLTLKDKTDVKIKDEIIKVPQYSECNVPTSGVLLSSSTASTLNSIRHAGKPNDSLQGLETNASTGNSETK